MAKETKKERFNNILKGYHFEQEQTKNGKNINKYKYNNKKKEKKKEEERRKKKEEERRREKKKNKQTNNNKYHT